MNQLGVRPHRRTLSHEISISENRTMKPKTMKPPTMLEPSELAPSRPRKPLRHLLTAFAVLGCFTQSQAATLLTGGDAADGWILPSAANVVFAVGMGTTGATLQGVTFTTSSPQLSGVADIKTDRNY
jgi:hypothetical protein